MHYNKYYHIVQVKLGWYATPNGFGDAWKYEYGPFTSMPKNLLMTSVLLTPRSPYNPAVSPNSPSKLALQDRFCA